MPQYLDSSCSCPREAYSTFDAICSKELALAITAETVVNASEFCVCFQADTIPLDSEDDLTLRDVLFGLNTKTGLYHIWTDDMHCSDHNRYSMRGVYVGKGGALNRVLTHAKRKLPTSDLFCVSFYECDNRIAKYLEQLFLDVYAFDLNENENPGTLELYACWDEDRRTVGTEMHNIANRARSYG